MATVVHHSPPRRQGHLALRVIRLVLVALVVVLAFLALSLALLVRPNAEGVDTMFGHPIFNVASGSMTPAIHAGDLIVDNPVTPNQATDLHAGQIISFRESSSGTSSLIVTHRVVAVLPGSAGAPVLYRTKGDANNAPDLGTVAPSQVLGVYAARVPFAAYVLSTLHQPLTFVVLIMIPVLYLAEEEVRRRRVLLGEQEAEHFTREQPDGTFGRGGHLASDLPLYRADSLRDLPDGELVYVVVGERAADALIGAGVAAVATVTGASVIPTDVSLQPLVRLRPQLWADSDGPGQAHMHQIAARLTALACPRIDLVTWPNPPEKGDAVDFINDLRRRGLPRGEMSHAVAALPRVPSTVEDDHAAETMAKPREWSSSPPGGHPRGERPAGIPLSEVEPEATSRILSRPSGAT
ncbi:MAG TPA: signal peptidase I [Chloroflexi bacterium]|jgi:signal peptidase|nr:signal peptidase I [Chloroflexota bacterium]